MYIIIKKSGKHIFSFYLNSAKKKIQIGGDGGDILFSSDMVNYELSLCKEFDIKTRKYLWFMYPASGAFTVDGKLIESGTVLWEDKPVSANDFTFSLSHKSSIENFAKNKISDASTTLVLENDVENFNRLVVEINGKKSVFTYENGKTITIGRNNSTIDIPFPEVSSEHLVLSMKNNEVFLFNKGKNGTWSNGVRVDNCKLELGRYHFSIAGKYSLFISLESEENEKSFYIGSLKPLFNKLEDWINKKELFKNHPIVLITGESGAGKEIFAEFAHKISARKGLFSTINSASIPSELMETELFGSCKGAFTDAETREGAFLLSNHGTLFLDEIGEMAFNLQSKLLRVLEDWTIRKVGENGSGTKVDVMVVAATNKELERSCFEGTFRKDLYYRLNTLSIHIPPLRERKEDVIPLALHIMYSISGKIITIDEDAKEKLESYSWPGNVRELKSLMTRFAYKDKNVLSISDIDFLTD